MAITVWDQQGEEELAELEECHSAIVHERMHGLYELSLSYPMFTDEAEHLQPFHLLSADGQWFRIVRVDRDNQQQAARGAQRQLVKVLARHIFYDLSYYVVDELEIEDPVTCTAALGAVLGHVGLDSLFSVSGLPGPELDLHIERMTAAEAVLFIAQRWGLILLRDNYELITASPTPGGDPLTIQYAKNLVGIQEIRQTDNVVTQVYPIGSNDRTLPEEYVISETWEGPDYPGFPLTRIVHFRDADTEEDLRDRAEAYLADHAEPETNYRIDCVLLEEEAEEEQYATYEDVIQVQVGARVDVDHEPMGIVLDRRVVGVERDLLLAINTRVELGKPLPSVDEHLDRMQDDLRGSVDELKGPERVQRWTQIVMRYVDEILGGSVTDVHPTLLLYTPVVLYYGVHRKRLTDVCDVLTNVEPGWTGTEDTGRFYVDDPETFVRQQQYRELNWAYLRVNQYIWDSVGPITGSNRLVNRINSAYADVYGSGTTDTRPADTMETAFGEEWGIGDREYYFASLVLNTLQDYVGNVSELYLEVGGGSSGAIGAINELYRLRANPNMTVSTDEPDNNVGKDGDIWFQFEE